MQPLTVYLVHCPRWDIRCPPYATALLAGNLKSKGHRVYARDFDVEFFHSLGEAEKATWYPYEHWTKWTAEGDREAFRSFLEAHGSIIERFARDILDTAPDVIGFTIRPGSLDFSCHLARKLKEINKNSFIIFGLPLRHPLELDELPFVDALSNGEADVTFPDFLEAFAGNDCRPLPVPGFSIRLPTGGVLRSESADRVPELSHLPFADYSHFDFRQYLDPRILPLMFSRGCINRCSFCSAHGQHFRYRVDEPDRIVQQIRHHIESCRIQAPCHVYAVDNLVNGDLKALAQMAVRFTALPHPITWEGMFCLRPQMTDDYLAMLARSGLTNVFIGLESASEDVLVRMKKRANLQEADRIIETLWRNGVAAHASIVVGHPGETEEAFELTYRFLDRHRRYLSGFSAFPLWLGDKHSDICQHPDQYDVDLTDPLRWTADQGRNTYDVRLARLERYRQLSEATDWSANLKRIQENRQRIHRHSMPFQWLCQLKNALGK